MHKSKKSQTFFLNRPVNRNKVAVMATEIKNVSVTAKDVKFRWLWHAGTRRYYYDVGMLADGTLYNRSGYPEDILRPIVLEAIEQRKIKRSEAAKKAGKTRAIRREKLIYEIVEKLNLGHKYGPRPHCIICKTALTDEQSIARGIGPECWQHVLARMTLTSNRQPQQAEMEMANN
jgi:hypothetical protein